MAEASNTLAGIVQMNDRNLADMDVTDLLQDTPLLQVMYAKTASQGGTLHKYIKQTVASGATFRAVNTGVLNAANQDELVTVTCTFLDGHFHRDVAIARGFKDGPGAFMARETMRAIKSMMVGLEKQILQGVSADASGFTGAPGYSFVDALTDGMVVNAGGSGGRSVWAIRSTDDDVAIVAGNEGNLDFNFDENQTPQKIITNASTGAGYMAYVADLGGYFALQFGSAYSVGRIVNLDSTTNNTLTDALISEVLSKFPASRPATHLVMDRVLLQELQSSRTTYSPTGQPAPFPDAAFNVPIVVTDQLGTSESAMTTTTTTTTTTT